MKVILLILLYLIAVDCMICQDCRGESEDHWKENFEGVYTKGNKNQLIVKKDSLDNYVYQLKLKKNKYLESGKFELSEAACYTKHKKTNSYWFSVYPEETGYERSIMSHLFFEYFILNENQVVTISCHTRDLESKVIRFFRGNRIMKKMIRLTKNN